MRRRGFSLMRWMARLPGLSEARRLEHFPPFWLMRIRVLELAPDWSRLRIRLPLTFISRNAGGNLFGGFQAALADPIPALACIRRFPGHAVWTRRLALDFRREGSTDLELRFEFAPARHAEIAAALAERGRATPCFEFAYYLADGRPCTVIHNTVAIRPRGYRPSTAAPGGRD